MTNQTPLPLRHDTILGVCEAIGQDFGFNPLYLRLAFIAPLFFAPMPSIVAYFGLGLVVAASRWLARDEKAVAVAPAASSPVASQVVAEAELAIAA